MKPLDFGQPAEAEIAPGVIRLNGYRKAVLLKGLNFPALKLQSFAPDGLDVIKKA